MTPWEERDDQTAKMIRREIEKVRVRVQSCRLSPHELAWHRAFGEIAGMHRILELIDSEANDVRPGNVLSV